MFAGPCFHTGESFRSPSSPPSNIESIKSTLFLVIVLLSVIVLTELASVITLVFKVAEEGSSSPVYQMQPPLSSSSSSAPPQMPTIIINGVDRPVSQLVIPTHKPPSGENVCQGKKPTDKPDVACIVDSMVNVGPQAGANVTQGYQGEMQVDYLPLTTPFWQNGMCPVNVHWHVGTEHYSAGQYDEHGTGPEADHEQGQEQQHRLRKLSSGGGEAERQGFQCHLYKENDAKFTTPFNWQHCLGMQVGQTYEVHWPHSAAGACGTPNQFQTPFYDGVFCHNELLTDSNTQIGVQAQVFVVVNDESYYYPDLLHGMIVDGDYGQDIAKYTGSATGTSHNNEICSQYSPITWQVDRQCHLISASSFDKMCADMKAQQDDMTEDLTPHGSRELVLDELAANNHQRRFLCLGDY